MESRTASHSQMASLNTSQSSLLKVSEHQLNAKFRSKRDLYKYLSEMCKTPFVYMLQHCSHSEVLPSTYRLREQGLLEADLDKPEALVALGPSSLYPGSTVWGAHGQRIATVSISGRRAEAVLARSQPKVKAIGQVVLLQCGQYFVPRVHLTCGDRGDQASTSAGHRWGEEGLHPHC